jgi:hypothetical protein
VSPDGQRLYVVKSATEPQVSRLVFVENWIEELKAKVPAGIRADRKSDRQ